jgi:hypothetical protein
VDAQRWGEDPDYPQDIEEAGDPRLEEFHQELKHEFGPDEPYYNPKNPMAQSFMKMKTDFEEFVDNLREDAAEFQQSDPEFADQLKNILNQVLPAYKIVQSVDEDVQNAGAEYGIN